MIKFKKYIGSYGQYKFYFVDDLEIRNSSLENEEFTNYALYEDFPNLIPRNEVWISKNISRDEASIIIDEALENIKLRLRGFSRELAYNLALSHSASERQKRIGMKLNPEEMSLVPLIPIADKIYIRKLHSNLTTATIYLVNGNMVRSIYKHDFVIGGHGYVYQFIPLDEIWIEKDVPVEERILVLIHEAVERKLMKEQQMDYEQAHEIASKKEWQYRTKLFH